MNHSPFFVVIFGLRIGDLGNDRVDEGNQSTGKKIFFHEDHVNSCSRESSVIEPVPTVSVKHVQKNKFEFLFCEFSLDVVLKIVNSFLVTDLFPQEVFLLSQEYRIVK